MKTYLVTGGLGFIGTNYILSIINSPQNFVINLDKKTYASNKDIFANLQNYKFVKGDICDEKVVTKIFENFDVDYVINFAAESHVDNSFSNPQKTIKSNVLGVVNLLFVANKFWKNKKGKRFIQISTDEVYGSSPDKEFFENDECHPTSPYACSKHSAELFVKSYAKNFNFPAIITRSSNNFGFYQHPEKLIPKVFLNACQNEPIPLYKNSKFHKRNWIFVEDNVSAINLVLQKGKLGETYNISSKTEMTNIEMIEKIINFCKQNINPKASKNLIKISPERPNDDERYFINTNKIESLGFVPTNFDENFEKTMRFYQNNLCYLKKQNKKHAK
ncbi:MAG: dTDP-glucose 4,6-dehydratase [Christensenellales bacterium]